MGGFRERRRVARIPIAGRFGARAQARTDVRLIDLSPDGARIEHLDLLRPRSTCIFELPPAFGSSVLSAQVIHSSVIDTVQTSGGERLLRYQSGLAFFGATSDQQTALSSALERLAARPMPTDGQPAL